MNLFNIFKYKKLYKKTKELYEKEHVKYITLKQSDEVRIRDMVNEIIDFKKKMFELMKEVHSLTRQLEIKEDKRRILASKLGGLTKSKNILQAENEKLLSMIEQIKIREEGKDV